MINPAEQALPQAEHDDGEPPDGGASDLADLLRRFIAAAGRAADCVQYDVSGIYGQGGNGGLTSSETVAATDALRTMIWEAERTLKEME